MSSLRKFFALCSLLSLCFFPWRLCLLSGGHYLQFERIAGHAEPSRSGKRGKFAIPRNMRKITIHCSYAAGVHSFVDESETNTATSAFSFLFVRVLP